MARLPLCRKIRPRFNDEIGGSSAEVEILVSDSCFLVDIGDSTLFRTDIVRIFRLDFVGVVSGGNVIIQLKVGFTRLGREDDDGQGDSDDSSHDAVEGVGHGLLTCRRP